MGELKKVEGISIQAVELKIIEDRIATHMQGAYQNLLQVGKCLLDAKNANLVPFGEWEEWVRRNTGMSERSAQRLMQAARSVPAGSAMERLPVSKIQAILALPEGEREEMAEKAADESMTVRDLRKQISGLLSGNKSRERQLEEARGKLQAQVTQNGVLAAAKAAAEDRAKALEGRLNAMLEAETSPRISPEAQAQIDQLKTDLKAAEDYAATQADLRQAAQNALLDYQQGRGIDDAPCRRFNVQDLVSAVQIFIGAAGVLPHMGAEISKLDSSSRAELQIQIGRVDEWVQSARRALSAEIVEL